MYYALLAFFAFATHTWPLPEFIDVVTGVQAGFYDLGRPKNVYGIAHVNQIYNRLFL
jgi:hypothetical protein